MFIPAFTFGEILGVLLLVVGVLLVVLAGTTFFKHSNFHVMLGMGTVMMAGGIWLADHGYRDNYSGVFVLGGLGLLFIASEVVPNLLHRVKRRK